jgi:hypothetical protein
MLKRVVAESVLKRAVTESLLDDGKVAVPAVVTASGTWIEWKKPVDVPFADGVQSVMVSLRHDVRAESGWSIPCLEYDGGRVAAQHRLISDFVRDERLRFEPAHFDECVTTKLQIVAEPKRERRRY